ncbi:MarR family winged helix-turn-helix transcriptional regulator [Kibdelosporangium lantanae]
MSTESPVGRQLARTAKAIGRALDQALADAGGSLPTYSVLLALKTEPVANQRELADSVGIQGATLTHHLNAMEADGLLTRRRDPHNRRVHVVELTGRGETLYARLAEVSVAFDRRLRTGVSDEDVQVLEQLLGRLYDNATRTGP